jgi:hypothetical protein
MVKIGANGGTLFCYAASDQASQRGLLRANQYVVRSPVRNTEAVCLATGSVVMDNQRRIHVAGKWKSTGDGKADDPA